MNTRPAPTAPCLCSNCATPDERRRLERAQAEERDLNARAFELFCADLDAGRPTASPETYRARARGEEQA
jgi:hypothetical protein